MKPQRSSASPRTKVAASLLGTLCLAWGSVSAQAGAVAQHTVRGTLYHGSDVDAAQVRVALVDANDVPLRPAESVGPAGGFRFEGVQPDRYWLKAWSVGTVVRQLVAVQRDVDVSLNLASQSTVPQPGSGAPLGIGAGVVFEDFEDGDVGDYTSVGAIIGGPDMAAAHDGTWGLRVQEQTFPGWIYRDLPPLAEGDTFSAWVRPGANGRGYVGFGADGVGTFALAVGPNTNTFVLQYVTYGSAHEEFAEIPFLWVADKWYLLEATWVGAGTISARVFDSDGTTELAQVSGTSSTFGGTASGGLAWRGFGGGHDFDTLVGVPPAPPRCYRDIVIAPGFMDISATGTDVTGLIANLDDGGVIVPIGFSFQFYESSITSIGFSTNGYLSDGSSLTDFTNDCPIPNTLTPNRGIYPYWSDLRLNEHGSMLHETMGAPGNQVFIAQWQDVGAFDDSNAHVTMQVKLLEACNEIEFHYATLDSGPLGAYEATGGEGTVGVEGTGGTVATMIGCNTPGIISTTSSYRIAQTGKQTPRFATVPNPGTFTADPAGGPTIGTNWAPTVTGALPSPGLDVVIVSTLAPIEVPLPFGTLLSNINTPLLQFNFSPGTPFAIPIANDCGLVGLPITTQGGSLSFGPLTIGLANALDLVSGSL